jgi:hypothetical protein
VFSISDTKSVPSVNYFYWTGALEAVIDYAMLQGHQARAHQYKNRADMMVVESSSNGNVYQLTPTERRCECDCRAHQSLFTGFAEDVKMASLLVDHQILKGQLPDKHVFSLWATWGVNDFDSYQVQQQQWEHRQNLSQRNKEVLKHLGVSLRQDIPGHFNVWVGSKVVGTVDQRFDIQNNSWWINQRQISRNNSVPGDHIHYGSPEEAAIALAKLTQVIVEGDRAKADLFGGGWDTPTEHLIESSPNFIDDINQEKRQRVLVSVDKNVIDDSFFDF